MATSLPCGHRTRLRLLAELKEKFDLEALVKPAVPTLRGPAGDRIYVEVPNGRTLLPQILKGLTTEIFPVAVCEPTLDDVFLNLTGRRFVRIADGRDESACAPTPVPEGKGTLKRFRGGIHHLAARPRRHFRDRARIFGSLATPIIFIFILGQARPSIGGNPPAAGASIDYKTLHVPRHPGDDGAVRRCLRLGVHRLGPGVRLSQGDAGSTGAELEHRPGKGSQRRHHRPFQGCLDADPGAVRRRVSLSPLIIVELILTLFLVAFR